MERREVLLTSIKATLGIMSVTNLSSLKSFSQGQEQEEDPLAEGGRGERVMDEESGDPDAEPETLNVSRNLLEKLLEDSLSRGIKKNAKDVAIKQLEIAHRYVGVSRSSNPEQVTQYLKLFKYRLRYPGPNGKYVPYCAVGVSFCACRAYCELRPDMIEFDSQDPNPQFRLVLADIKKYYFKPTPSCIDMLDNARTRGIWVPAKEIAWSNVKPGWLVLFDWKRVGHPNHVGFVDKSLKARLKTVEFNTSITATGSKSNGGAVATKERDPKFVLGYIKTY